MSPLSVIGAPLSREDLKPYRLDDVLVKAVVDCDRRIMAVGGEMHADEEQLLLEQGSAQENLWGINLYPDDASESWIEFDSLINVRPSQGNRSRNVEDASVRQAIVSIVRALVKDA